MITTLSKGEQRGESFSPVESQCLYSFVGIFGAKGRGERVKRVVKKGVKERFLKLVKSSPLWGEWVGRKKILSLSICILRAYSVTFVKPEGRKNSPLCSPLPCRFDKV
jgi:hypothetical protein